jgi:hypothetical protein
LCGKNDDEQVIATWGYNRWRIVRFNQDGKYLGVDQSQGDWSEIPPLHNFRPQVVRMKKFILPDLHIGIIDLPDYLQQFMDNPDEYLHEMYTGEEIESSCKSEIHELDQWFVSNRFVFQFHEYYWMNEDGTVNSH